MQAAYRNDQRQEFVNNVAYKHGTGLGTAPWYGVPGTAYDFRHAKPAGPTYHTDVSSPSGYGYQASVPQYHSQPSYGHGGHSGGGGGGYGAKAGDDTKPTGSCGGYAAPAEPHSKVADAARYPPTQAGKAAPYAGTVDEGGYGLAMDSKGYNEAEQGYSANHGKVGYDGMAKHAGYVAGSYEALGYGYMY